MKGLILAGGTGSRMGFMMDVTPKALIPVAMQPLISFAIKKLKAAKITDIGIVVNTKDRDRFTSIIGGGSLYGVKFTYIYQPEPLGEVDALAQAKEFIGSDAVAVICTDNLFDGQLMFKAGNSQIVTKNVTTPTKGLFATYSGMGNLTGVSEDEKTGDMVTGLYCFTDGKVLAERIGKLKEKTIEALLNLYIKETGLTAHKLPGFFLDVNAIPDYYQSQMYGASKVFAE
jgi:glucose-1-phosphate thymidylyltransferase